jgi:hypothetical protein
MARNSFAARPFSGAGVTPYERSGAECVPQLILSMTAPSTGPNWGGEGAPRRTHEL